MIEVKDLTKRFVSRTQTVEALKGITLTMDQGDIFGIIGMSGAGKSTFVRCLNFLERPTSGTVIVNGKNLSALSEQELRESRKEIGMIFQHCNLRMQKNVIDNICFPLKISGVKQVDARARANELLEVVGLADKATAYPSQLSGGQKQRVAIARAIANNPKILLCDEATSALDPQTTKAILELLKEINQKYGITIVVITHEMAVVQEICNKVAILDHGRMVETGGMREIFAAPKSVEAKKMLMNSSMGMEVMTGHRKVRIVFRENSAFEPVIGNMTLKFKVPVNILYANTQNLNGIAAGEMILQLPDDEEIAEGMVTYMKERQLDVEEVTDDVLDDGN